MELAKLEKERLNEGPSSSLRLRFDNISSMAPIPNFIKKDLYGSY